MQVGFGAKLSRTALGRLPPVPAGSNFPVNGRSVSARHNRRARDCHIAAGLIAAYPGPRRGQHRDKQRPPTTRFQALADYGLLCVIMSFP